jgi:hypothetical protein
LSRAEILALSVSDYEIYRSVYVEQNREDV